LLNKRNKLDNTADVTTRQSSYSGWRIRRVDVEQVEASSGSEGSSSILRNFAKVVSAPTLCSTTLIDRRLASSATVTATYW